MSFSEVLETARGEMHPKIHPPYRSSKSIFFFIGILIYQAANMFDASNRWSLSLNFIMDVSIPFSLFLRLYLIILILGEFTVRYSYDEIPK